MAEVESIFSAAYRSSHGPRATAHVYLPVLITSPRRPRVPVPVSVADFYQKIEISIISLCLVAFEFLCVILEIDMQRGECSSPQVLDNLGPQRLQSIVHAWYRAKRWQVSFHVTIGKIHSTRIARFSNVLSSSAPLSNTTVQSLRGLGQGHFASDLPLSTEVEL